MSDDPLLGSIDDDATHHLLRVLRLRPGDAITLTDGRGRWRGARITSTTITTGSVEPIGDEVEAPAPKPVGVAFALTKGDRPDLVVQKLTEIGIDRIVPFVADNSVVRWDAEKAAHHVARWRDVAREAVQQCRRVRLPLVEELTTVAALASRAQVSVVRADLGAEALAARPMRFDRPLLVAVGPEGGWSAAERLALPDAVAVGDAVLRAETAAIAAGVLLAAARTGAEAPFRASTYG